MASCQGPWAVVAGASEGLGAAFAEALAARGLNVVAIARRPGPLAELETRLRDAHGVEVRALSADLADAGFTAAVADAVADVEVGTVVYNAAHSFVGPLLDRPPEDAMRVVDVNVRAPLALIHELAPAMVDRGRGTIVLVSSLSGNQGVPRIAAYAASKAFTTTLAESLWAELREQGVDVVGCCAGAIRTPGYARALTREAPGTLDPGDVAEATLRAVGRGPVVVPGATNKIAAFALRRLLPRRTGIGIIGRSLAGLDDA